MARISKARLFEAMGYETAELTPLLAPHGFVMGEPVKDSAWSGYTLYTRQASIPGCQDRVKLSAGYSGSFYDIRVDIELFHQPSAVAICNLAKEWRPYLNSCTELCDPIMMSYFGKAKNIGGGITTGEGDTTLSKHYVEAIAADAIPFWRATRSPIEITDFHIDNIDSIKGVVRSGVRMWACRSCVFLSAAGFVEESERLQDHMLKSPLVDTSPELFELISETAALARAFEQDG